MGRALLASFIFCSLGWAAADLEVVFNHNEQQSYQDPYRHFVRPGHNVESDIIQLIDSAQKRIWLAVYELRLPLVAHALKSAYGRGVDVRVVTENTNNYTLDELSSIVEDSSNEYEIGRLAEYFAYADLNSDGRLSNDELDEMDAMRVLRKAGIPVVDDTEDGSKGSGLMHHKFLVIDSEILFTGSGNFTWSDLHGDKLKVQSLGNANNFLKINNRKINQAFADEFLLLWGDGPGHKKNSSFNAMKSYRGPLSVTLSDGSKISVQFGGTHLQRGWDASPNGLIASHLKTVQSSVEAAFFVWSEQKLTDVIPRHIARNTRVLIDPFFAYRPYSELLDLLGVEMYSDQCKIEVNNFPWSSPALNSGTVALSPGDLLHHKFAVLDAQKVITGSHNWSANANNNNDEVVIVIESQKVAAQYRSEFLRLNTNSSLGVTPQLISRIEAANERCTVH